MEAIHFSCQSDKVNDTSNYGGVIIYGLAHNDLGTYEGMNGGRYSANSGKDKYRSGYCIIKNTDEMDSIPGEEGQVHGRIVHFLLNTHPSVIAKAGGAMAGFSVQKGEVKFNSWSCNAAGAYMRKDSKSMSDIEIKLFKWAIEGWRKSGQS